MHYYALPIGLQTDASDYGVGGYLFQTVGRSEERRVGKECV